MTCSLGDDEVFSYGDTCSYTCGDGYKLTGSSIAACGSDGQWNMSSILECTKGKPLCMYVCMHVCKYVWYCSNTMLHLHATYHLSLASCMLALNTRKQVSSDIRSQDEILEHFMFVSHLYIHIESHVQCKLLSEW